MPDEPIFQESPAERAVRTDARSRANTKAIDAVMKDLDAHYVQKATHDALKARVNLIQNGFLGFLAAIALAVLGAVMRAVMISPPTMPH